MMEIRASTTIRALHHWPKAAGIRSYLKYPHLHDFKVTVWARVSHSDRDIEFHNLRDKIYDALIYEWAGRRDVGNKWVHDFGDASCEDLGNWILRAIPEVHRVRVMEDESCGAEVSREIPDQPPIVTICGSTRFKQAWLDAMDLLEREGCAAFAVGSFMHADDVPIRPQQKIEFDHLHKQKIAMSDSIYVLNVDDYIGESTRSEINFAKSLGKKIRYLEPRRSGSD